MRANYHLVTFFLTALTALFLLNPPRATAQFERESITDVAEKLDSIVVEAFRAGKRTPVTHSSVGEKELKRASPTHSLPMLLSSLPSVVATTEGSNGMGYSSIRIRGSDPTRINVTLNGITLNDGESQQLFWVNLPALQGALQDVQVTRGVGTSLSGAGSFGGSLNLRTKFLSSTPYGGAELAIGSYNSLLSSFEVGSGRGKSGLSFDLRFTKGGGDGYIRNGFSDLTSLYATIGWYKNNHSLKLNYLMGDQVTGITWEGISKEQEKSDRKFNSAGLYKDEAGNIRYWDRESDNYQQHHLQLHYTTLLKNSLQWASTLHFTRGYGYYNNYKWNKKYSGYGIDSPEIGGITYSRSDFITRQALGNYFGAFNSTLTYSGEGIKSVSGVTLSYHDGEHFGVVDWIKNSPANFEPYRWYLNWGYKWDFSLFSRVEAEPSESLTLFLDLQYRAIHFSLDGEDKDFVSLKWGEQYHFFNPKIGATWSVAPSTQLYASLSLANKEPGRADVKESIKAGAADKILPEAMLDWEMGIRYRGGRFSFEGNLYLMEYNNQLIPTGRISETGYTIKENVKESYRRGVELSAAWMVVPSLQFGANLTLSKNRIKNYTHYVDLFDPNWVPLGQEKLFFKEVEIAFSPSIIGGAQLVWQPATNLSATLSGKYVGSHYLDNRGDSDNMIPHYGVASLNLLKGFSLGGGREIELSLFVDNLLNHRYYVDGWSYFAHFNNGTTHLEERIYPQPKRNFMFKVKFKFD